MTCGQVWCRIFWICALLLTFAHFSHTQQWEVNKHTQSHTHTEQWAANARVSSHSGYWGWRECWTFTPTPTDNPFRTWDSNLKPSGYKSDSLTIRPRLPRLIYLPDNPQLFTHINSPTTFGLLVPRPVTVWLQAPKHFIYLPCSLQSFGYQAYNLNSIDHLTTF